MQKSVTDATVTVGILGHCGKQKLTKNEDDLLMIYISMGTPKESADKIFFVEPNIIGMLGDQDNDFIRKIILGINKIQSPYVQTRQRYTWSLVLQ